MRFWRDGLGLTELFDHSFTGDWPELFGARTDRLTVDLPGRSADTRHRHRRTGGSVAAADERTGPTRSGPGTDSSCCRCSVTSTRRCRAVGPGLHRRCPSHHHAGPGRQDRPDGGHHRARRCTRRADRAGGMSDGAGDRRRAPGSGAKSPHGCAMRVTTSWCGTFREAISTCDISDPDAVSAAMEQTVREHGVPTRVVTSAGIGCVGPVAEQSHPRSGNGCWRSISPAPG